MYGYILTQNVKEVVDISESTLYPVLRRLQKEAYLVTYDQPFCRKKQTVLSDYGQGQRAACNVQERVDCIQIQY